ncbi:uncharacterized protein LOC141818687 [Curcuma longa]|uniref:uncharacterized protein LOC141818687 n=1 Tax=Curcuma longa TaxID=136217 RepID=UPI003D9E4FA9
MACSSSLHLHGTLALSFRLKCSPNRRLPFACTLPPAAASTRPLRSATSAASSADDLRPALGENPEGVISGEWPENFSLLSYDDLRAYLETQIVGEKMQPSATLATVMSTQIRVAKPEQTLGDIDHNFEVVSGLPVVDDQLRCIGVISKKDKSRASNGVCVVPFLLLS